MHLSMQNFLVPGIQSRHLPEFINETLPLVTKMQQVRFMPAEGVAF